MTATFPAPIVDFSFPHRWQAEILRVRPLILPPGHFIYPRDAEEVERGALEVFVHPGPPDSQLFLATCALGFRDPAVPTGIWSTPNPDEICAVAGGYAYLIDTTRPERFTMLTYRPVMQIHPVVDSGLILFVGHYAISARGAEGEAWQSEKLSDEGVTVTSIEAGKLSGLGWDLMTDTERPFTIDLGTGAVIRPPA